MIRTTLSFCALFGSLIFISKLLQESSGPVADDSPAAHASDSQQVREAADQPQVLPVVNQAALPLLPKISPFATLCGQEHFASTRLTVVQTAFEEESAPENAASDPFSDLNIDRLINGESTEEEKETPEEADESTTDTDVPAVDAKPSQPELSAEMLELRLKLRECLSHYYHRPENVAIRSPWGAMHAMIAYGVDTELVAGDRRVNAIGWLCYNGVCNKQQLFHTRGGRLQARIGVGVQGHAGQFLAMLAQSRVKSDFPMKADGMDFTVADLIRHEQDTCRPNTELTFKLIALVHYLKSDDKWKSNDGQDWDIPRLIKEELKQPIIGAACGGTHRMTGFSYAVRKREQRKEEFTGQWLRAQKFVTAYHDYTFRLQNPDGSFSTDWFAGRADFGPPSRRLETTGHVTEWLAFSLSEEELQDPRMVKAVDYLTNLLLEGRREKWSIGPLGHGLHALAIYDERVFGGQPGHRRLELARQPQANLEK